MKRYEAKRAFPEVRSAFPDSIDTQDSVENNLVHPFDIWDLDAEPNLDHAERYLLAWQPDRTEDILKALAKGEKTAFRADDLLRVCRLQAAPMHDPLVTSHFVHILSGKKFNPAIMVNDGKHSALVDGYHRVSTAWWLDPQMTIPVLRAVV